MPVLLALAEFHNLGNAGSRRGTCFLRRGEIHNLSRSRCSNRSMDLVQSVDHCLEKKQRSQWYDDFLKRYEKRDDLFVIRRKSAGDS